MPNLLDWLYQCPTGNIVCTTTLFCVVFVVAWIFFAFAVGIASELIKKWSTFKKFRERLNRWIKTPRIKHYFALPAHNDLRLYIKTPNRSKDVYVECWFKDYRDISGKKYLSEHHNELKLVENSYGVGAHPPFFGDTLASNDKREIKVGIPHNEKVALYVGDAHVFGFQDGMYEYIIGCTVRHQNMNLDLPDFSIWLIIENGVLVEIKDNL